jgi:hypothetical protein
MAPTSTFPAAGRTPDLTAFILVHRALRRDAGRLVTALEGLGDGDTARARALRRWYGHYRAELHAHHQLEDDLWFPVVAERVPTFAAHTDRLAREHHVLEDAAMALTARLDELAGDGGASAPARRAARDAACELREVIDEHLDFEDADIVPLITRHLSADDVAEVEARTRARLDRRQLPFLVPWLLSAATQAERTRMLAVAPWPLKFVWYASRRRHDRMTARALGRTLSRSQAASLQEVA